MKVENGVKVQYLKGVSYEAELRHKLISAAIYLSPPEPDLHPPDDHGTSPLTVNNSFNLSLSSPIGTQKSFLSLS